MRFHRDCKHRSYLRNLSPSINLFFTPNRKSFDVGTNLFIGNLDPDVDEEIVYDTFSTFGGIASNPMPQPVFMFANQAGLDMLETTLVALQDIALEKIFDEFGRNQGSLLRLRQANATVLSLQGFACLPSGICLSTMGDMSL
ncbi:unnamed protein product, partial [Brassica oleracea var. botrytis]